jgi:hypothetical protein
VLVAVAVMPGAPVLVPTLSQAAASETDACRAAIDAAVSDLVATRPDEVVVVGGGRRTRRHAEGSQGSFAPVGVPESMTLGRRETLVRAPDDDAPLPLSLTMGAWALSRVGWSGPASGVQVADDEAPQVCLGLGAGIADTRGRTALLVVADGTARRGPGAPGYTDERSRPFDDRWTAAIAAADVATLATLDPVRAAELMMAGRAPLQVLAAAATGVRWQAEVLAEDDRYGVQYVVARWHRRDA